MKRPVLSSFQIATLTPGLLTPSVGIATSRSGGLAILDFEYNQEPESAREAILRFGQLVHTPFGIKVGGRPDSLKKILDQAPASLRMVILTAGSLDELAGLVELCRQMRLSVLFEASCIEHVRITGKCGVDGIVAKGNEAGGRVADETTFILLQRFLAESSLPVWAHGGIGLHTAAACAAAGAAGIILDSQLALTRESPYNELVKSRIATMDGSETICLGEQLGEAYRFYFRPGSSGAKALQEIETQLLKDGAPRHQILDDWRRAVLQRVGWDGEQNALMLGQDAAFAASLAKRFGTVGGVLQAIRDAVRSHREIAAKFQSLAPGSPLAASNGTRYPILQGPMTRVSDVPEFAARVSEEGGLPFLALALMRGPEVKTLLKQARERMGKMPWGVGVLGFVPAELRKEQMEAVREYRPPFALIAGGRPDQARELEQEGTPTYLHVPSPGLLKMFVEQGARRFVFEGRECGGHVGPRTSFVLWEQMVDVLLNAPQLEVKPQEFDVVFAAGIHDALSAAMVAVIAAPLAERGVRLGVLLGTSYLFTEEAVSAGAVKATFQEQALQCNRTVLLETGPGHSTRCVDTPFASFFYQEKRRLLTAGVPAEEIREKLEGLNLGRLRIASKGVTRNNEFERNPGAAKLVEIGADVQVVEGMYMIGQIAALRKSVCTVQSLHHDVSVGSCNKLQQWAEISLPVTSPEPRQRSSDVAIIGMACLMPKAPDLETFWQNILQKVDAVTEVPKERWDPERYFDADPKVKDKIYSRWGGFLDDVAFDPIRYGMPPASLRSIEPSQLLTLEVVRAALEDAGYAERAFPRERTSVILGAGGGAADLGLGYGARSFIPMLEDLPEFKGRSQEIVDRLGDRLPEWTEDSFAGILTNVSAGRVANRFDLGGSNFTVDAACASSLAAVSLGVKELETGTSDMVIVGGVDTMQNPFTYLCFSKTHALSPRGRCRTFDESADGIAISEGIAMMVLKRLDDAERDGDRIYSVIKGAGSSSDGKDRGLTAPRPEGQARALDRAYAKAGISPATVGLVEAHGTGTVAGDGAEVQALTKVFSAAMARQQGCAIGSVKSMVGHSKCAAGSAGMIKAALALHHKVLPPTLGVQKPNSRAHFEESPFFVNTESRPWLRSADGDPRRAGVSAFGFGGTNFHIVMEEYTGSPVAQQADPQQEWPQELFVWRAASLEALAGGLDSWIKALDIEAKPALRDLAYLSWNQAQETQPGLQIAILANSLNDLKEKLVSARQALKDPKAGSVHDPKGTYFSEQALASEGKLAFLFPGQGSQYPRMLQDLLIHFPEMRRPFEDAARALASQLDRPLLDFIFPPPTFTREEESARQRALTQTNVAQPAIGAASLAMLELLRQFGLTPEMTAGHSYGEYVALAAAGAFNAETLIRVSEARGRFIVEESGAETGTMAAVDADAETVRRIIKNFNGLCLANANAPRQNVISGPRAAVQEAVEQFAAQGVAAKMIPVACAFHSHLVAPAQQRLADFLTSVDLSPLQIPVYSNATAAAYPPEPGQVRNRLAQHLTSPVEFVHEIEAMYEAGARIFVEVGPRGVLTGLVDQILGDRPKLAVASDQNGRAGITQLLHLLGQLFAQGCSLNLSRLYRGRNTRRLTLSSLQRECAQKALPASTWLVNGARAIPLKQAQAPTPKQAPVAHEKAAAASAGAGFSSAPSNSLHGAPMQKPSHFEPRSSPVAAAPIAATPVTASSSSVDGIPQVMSHFQQTMGQFLETQKRVMLAFLGSEEGSDAGQNSSVPPSSAPVPEWMPFAEQSAVARQSVATAVRTPVTPDVKPAMASSVAPPAANAVAAAVPQQMDLMAQLLAIVSDRTGYPAEMLDVNLDLESDLGIDSIKRVEIFGTLQQSISSSGVPMGAGLMEQLTGVRTLRGIVDRVSAYLRPEVATAPVNAPVKEEMSASSLRPQLLAQLVAIVSDRTGYPAEMLDLNLDLEADLGIDSIKRVEILGTFQNSPSMALVPAEGLMEKLAGVRTLQGIIDQVCGPSSNLPSPKVQEPAKVLEAPHTEEKPEAPQIGRFVLRTADAPLLSTQIAFDKHRTILITTGGHPVGRAFTRDLLEQNYNVAIVSPGSSFRELGPGSYTGDLMSPGSVKDLIGAIAIKQGPLGAIVNLLPLEGNANTLTLTDREWKEQINSGVKSLFCVAKAAGGDLVAAAQHSTASFIAVTGMGGAFLVDVAADQRTSFAVHGAIAGFVKSFAIERPEVRAKVIDLNLEEDSETLSKNLLQEFQTADSSVEVGYRFGRRCVPAVVESAIRKSGRTPLPLDSSMVILITGGARGITALAAKRLARLCQPTLVLAGRSSFQEREEGETAGLHSVKELKAALMDQLRARGQAVAPAAVEKAYARLLAEREVRNNLSEMRQLGAKIHYHSVDVQDPVAFGSLIDSIYNSFGRVDGVIHGAGVIEDKLIEDKTLESFNRVFDTKVESAFVLSRKLRPQGLSFLVFFSSVSGRFGNRGQADYAAANEVLNKLAVCLDREWPAHVTAINWGPWDADGMVSAEVRKQFNERGVTLIPSEDGVARMEDEIRYGRLGESEVVIGGAGWKQPSKPENLRNDLPLMGKAISMHEGDGLEFIRLFDPAVDLYLNDHQLDGRPVVPLAIATELMAEVAAHGWPDMQVSAVRDLRLFNGVVLDNGEKPVRVLAKALPSTTKDAVSVEVEVTAINHPHRRHYRATVDLVKRLPKSPEIRLPGPADGRTSMNVARMYKDWLFHGPLFQGITRVDWIGTGGMKAEMRTSSPRNWLSSDTGGDWLVDPLMFDCALQLILVWAREHWDMTALPTGFQSLRRFVAPVPDLITCEMRLMESTGNQTIHADVYFRDAATGLLIATIEDMQGACSKALNRLSNRELAATVSLT